MAPSPTGTAFCIAWPRSFRSRAASASCRAPAAASAEYSPSEWPATMARQAGERLAAVLLQDAHDRDADRHQRRLGVLGEDQVGFRPFAHQFRQILLQRLVDLLEDVAGGGEGVGQVDAHADGLGSLSRKDESATHEPFPLRSWRYYSLFRSIPRSGEGYRQPCSPSPTSP